VQLLPQLGPLLPHINERYGKSRMTAENENKNRTDKLLQGSNTSPFQLHISTGYKVTVT
jgi:hypothetical protein